VIIYSSECVYPLAVVGNIHYATINDLTWVVNSEGHTRLAVASSDGFVSFVNFDTQENGLTILGERLNHTEVPEKLKGIYEAMEQVNFKKFENEAKENAKKTQFKPVTFKSKNAQAAT
jgi:hypothetical protein